MIYLLSFECTLELKERKLMNFMSQLGKLSYD